uniref:Uncharacterized protein n=1 Tax=Glossina brevipalpis TaxID=37001 RepID=A0A1A9W7M5_9MUSC
MSFCVAWRQFLPVAGFFTLYLLLIMMMMLIISLFKVSTLSKACLSCLSNGSFKDSPPFSKGGLDFFDANGANGVVGLAAFMVGAGTEAGALAGVIGVAGVDGLGICGVGLANGVVGAEAGFWGVGVVTDVVGVVGLVLFVGFKVTVTVVVAGLVEAFVAAGSGIFGATTVGLLSRTLFGVTVLVFG